MTDLNNMQPGDAAIISEAVGLALREDRPTVVARLTPTLIVTTDGRKFRKSTGRETKRSLWGSHATLRPAEADKETRA